MKPFDEKFADNVRRAFDDFKEEMPPHAWEDMKARLDGKGKARVVAFLPFLAKAAGVALLLVMSGYFYFSFLVKDADYLAEAETETQIYDSVTADNDSLKPAIHEGGLDVSGAVLAEQPQPPVAAAPEIFEEKEVKSISESFVEEKMLVAQAGLPETEDAFPEVQPAENISQPELPTLALRPSITQAPNARITPGTQTDTGPAPGSNYQNRLTWGITAGSMLAFAENRVSDAPGYAAGLTAEYAFNELISFSSGGLLTYHQFELVNFAKADFASDYIPGNTNLTEISLTGNNQYEMLALEIPLNAQFSIMETHNRRLYVGTGLSSLIYFQQRFSGVNTAYFERKVFNELTGNYDLQYNASTFVVDEQYPAFSRFDFGRLLNFSLGYVIRGENSSMVIEPFVKLPIGTLTSREINLGLGGISIRYRFSGN